MTSQKATDHEPSGTAVTLFFVGIIVSPILTWAFDVSGIWWGLSWLITGLALAAALIPESTAAILLVTGIVTSPILTWGFEVSGWWWGLSWLITGYSLAVLLIKDSAVAAAVATGTVVASILTWGFDVSPWIWGLSWLMTGALLLGFFVDEGDSWSAGLAFKGGAVGVTILALVIVATGSDNGSSRSGRSSQGFTSSESDCIQYAAMQYTEAYNTNNCRRTLGRNNCATLATAIQVRRENGQDTSALTRQHSAQC